MGVPWLPSRPCYDRALKVSAIDVSVLPNPVGFDSGSCHGIFQQPLARLLSHPPIPVLPFSTHSANVLERTAVSEREPSGNTVFLLPSRLTALPLPLTEVLNVGVPWSSALDPLLFPLRHFCLGEFLWTPGFTTICVTMTLNFVSPAQTSLLSFKLLAWHFHLLDMEVS